MYWIDNEIEYDYVVNNYIPVDMFWTGGFNAKIKTHLFVIIQHFYALCSFTIFMYPKGLGDAYSNHISHSKWPSVQPYSTTHA